MPPRTSADTGPSLWRRIWYGLLGGSVYRLLATRGHRAYAAFVAIAVTTALVPAVVSGWSAHKGLATVVALWPSVPEFSIQDGHLVAPKATAPVRVTRGGTVIAVEPGASSTASPLRGATAGLAVTENDLILRPGPGSGQDRVIPLSAFGTAVITKAALGQLVKALATGGVLIGIGVELLYDLLRDFIRAAVIAWMAWIAVRLAGRAPTWSEAWRIGLAAWTLPLIAEAASIFVPVPSWSVWLVAAVYAMTGSLQLPAASS